MAAESRHAPRANRSLLEVPIEKFRVELFDLETRESRADGTPRYYRLPKERIRALGQGSTLVIEVRVLTREGACDIGVEVFTSTLAGLAPADGGKQVKLNHNGTGNLDRVVLNTLGRHYIETETRLQADVEVVVDVRASSGTQVVRTQVVVVATVYGE